VRPFGHRLQPDGLPDARSARVETTGIGELGRLLAAWLRAAVGVAGTNNDHNGLPGDSQATQITGEGGKAAAVTADLAAVDPHCGVIVDRLKVQQHPPPSPRFGDIDLAPVPDSVQEVNIADAGERGLRAERDDNVSRQGTVDEAAVKAAIPTVDLELPLTVQAKPIGAHELGAGVLRPRQGRCVHGTP